MFFSTQICVDKWHPLHTMWLLSCYMEDARARKKKIPDTTLRRSDLVKILRELVKMFSVDGQRRGFALAMNSDMFNAVVYNLEFKAIDLLSTSRKLLAKISRKNPFGVAEADQVDMLAIDLNFASATAKTTIFPRFPEGDLQSRFNQITMVELEDLNPPANPNIMQDNEFGDFSTFADIEAMEATHERSSQIGGLDRLEAGILPENILPHDDDNLAAPVLDLESPQHPASPVVEEYGRPVPRIIIDTYRAPTEQPLTMDLSQDDIPAAPDAHDVGVGIDNEAEAVPPAVDEGLEEAPPAVVGGVEINVIPDTQEEDEVLAPLPGPNPIPVPVVAPKKKSRRKKRKLIVDQVITLSRDEIRAQIVVTEPEARVKDRAKPAAQPRSLDNLFHAPIHHFDSDSDLGQLWNTQYRNLLTKKRPREESSSSSEEDERSRQVDDRELSSLRDGLHADFSSIHAISGILRDENQESVLQDEPEQQRSQDLRVSELRNAPEVTVGQADLGSSMSTITERVRKDSDISGLPPPASPASRTYDEAGSDVFLIPPPGDDPGLNVTPEHQQPGVEDALGVDVTPQHEQPGDAIPEQPGVEDVDIPQVGSPVAVDPYADVNLLALNITAPQTSAGDLLDKMKDTEKGPDETILFSSVCPSASTAREMAAVSFFNLLKLQRLAYVECDQEKLTDDIHIQLQLQNGSEYGSCSEGYTASSTD
jgi:hypothetical protein